jgi:fructose-bisphosphate aldolase class II
MGFVFYGIYSEAVMPLVSSKEMLLQARKEHFGVGAFNVHNMEMVQAIVEAAEEESAPVILQVSRGTIDYAGLEFAANIVKFSASHTSVPVVLHLDHGTDFQQNVRCLRAGFTSLMYDGTERMLNAYKQETGDNRPSFEVVYENVQSRAAFEDNALFTKKIVDIAHACGVPVEAELGKITRISDYSDILRHGHDYKERLPGMVQERVRRLSARPEMAEEFVRLTGCDTLAVACGSVHAMRDDVQPLNIQLVEEIASRTDTPLVLHGSSGVVKTRRDAKTKGIGLEKGEGSIEEAIQCGIAKINVSTELQSTFLKSLRDEFGQKPDEKDMRKLFLPAKHALKEKVRSLIRLFGSSGKAPFK